MDFVNHQLSKANVHCDSDYRELIVAVDVERPLAVTAMNRHADFCFGDNTVVRRRSRCKPSKPVKSAQMAR